MKGRVVCTINSEAARLRRQRRKEANAEVKDLIDAFLEAASGGEAVNGGDGAATTPIAGGGIQIQLTDDQSDE